MPCHDCIHCTPDEYEVLDLGDRAGECSRLQHLLEISIRCGTYCLGGEVGTISVPLDFECASYVKEG